MFIDDYLRIPSFDTQEVTRVGLDCRSRSIFKLEGPLKQLETNKLLFTNPDNRESKIVQVPSAVYRKVGNAFMPYPVFAVLVDLSGAYVGFGVCGIERFYSFPDHSLDHVLHKNALASGVLVDELIMDY